ncbi:hypothetical protein Emed_007414 [Eimeria media]
MRPAAALDLLRLKASLWTLGLECLLPHSRGLSRLELILLTLVQLKHLLEPPQFTGEETAAATAAEEAPLSPGGKEAAAAVLAAFKTPEERRQLLQRLVEFMQQRVGVSLDVSSLAAAEGPAVSELCKLAETLAAAATAALKRQQQGNSDASASREGEEAGGSTLAIPAQYENLSKNASEETVEKIKRSASKLLSSLQWYYGEAQIEERKAAASFLDELLGGGEGPQGNPKEGAPQGAPNEGAPQGAPEGGPPSDEESYARGRALLLQRLEQARAEAAEVERNNETLESQIAEIKEKIKAADNDAERLKRQLLLLKRAHVTSGPSSAAAAAAGEDRVQQQQQEKLRELYLEYARRSAACDALMASVEDMADKAEEAAALSRRRMHEAARQRVLQQEAAAAAAGASSFAYTHSSAVRPTPTHVSPFVSSQLLPNKKQRGHSLWTLES